MKGRTVLGTTAVAAAGLGLGYLQGLRTGRVERPRESAMQAAVEAIGNDGGSRNAPSRSTNSMSASSAGFDSLCVAVCYLQNAQLDDGADKKATMRRANSLAGLFAGLQNVDGGVANAASSRYWGVRYFAAEVAGRNRWASAKSLLSRLAKDPNAHVRARAAELLASSFATIAPVDSRARKEMAFGSQYPAGPRWAELIRQRSRQPRILAP